MAVTYRLCSIFSASFQKEGKEMRRKIETFEMLVKLIEENFMRERTVAFYADLLCLTPKYLSVIVKSVCGKTVQQIASDLSFPNASSFGTFFKKHTGLSPKNYRMGAE
jgi:AraC family transcriptional activator of pobA